PPDAGGKAADPGQSHRIGITTWGEMAVRRLLLGIDAGTSVVKAVVYQMDGTPLAMHSTKTKIRSVHPLWMEVDMNEVWSAVVNTVSALIHSASIRPEEILAIGVTGQGDGCWLVTAEGLPVRSAILWADGRAADQVDNWFGSRMERRHPLFPSMDRWFFPGRRRRSSIG